MGSDELGALRTLLISRVMGLPGLARLNEFRKDWSPTDLRAGFIEAAAKQVGQKWHI